MKCPNCNAEVTGRFCEYCGSELPKEKSITNINNNSKTIINNYYSSPTPSIQKQQSPEKESPPVKKSTYRFEGAGATILWLLFFFPVGLIRVWTKKEFPKVVRIIITVFFALIIIAALVPPPDSQHNETLNVAPSPSSVPLTRDYNSTEDAFTEGFKDGFGDSTEERKEDIEESIDSIRDSIDYIFSE